MGFSSVMFGQNVQNLSSLMTRGLLCLPFSTERQWSLSRSLVSVRLGGSVFDKRKVFLVWGSFIGCIKTTKNLRSYPSIASNFLS